MASDYYNNTDYLNDFNKNLSEVQGSIAGKEAEYNQYKGQSEAAYQAQQEAMKNRTSYNDLLSQAEESKGVNQARQQYQSDVEAVNAINSAMNTLPSSINANSNVVLTNAQRQAALGNQMNKYLNSYDYATRQAEKSSNLYQLAQNAAFTAAEAGATEQQQKISNAMNAYSQEAANLQNAYNQLANERSRMFDIYGQKYDEDYRRAQQRLQDEMQQRELAMQKYISDQNAAAQRYASEAGLRLQQYKDNKAAQQRDNSFASWLNSEAALNSGDWAEGMDNADKMANLQALSSNYANALASGNTNALANIMRGSTYQDYLNWRNQ